MFLCYNQSMLFWQIYTFVSVFILGAIIGSFLNVVILRLNTGRGINGRSSCPHCRYQLKWFDLIPIVSWFLLHGKCRNCRSKISIQYPLVEFATATIFAAILYAALPLWSQTNLVILSFVWNAIIFSILIVIFVYDLYHKIIPDVLAYAFAGLGLVQTLVLMPANFGDTTILVLDLLAGPIMFLPFFLLWFVSGGRWIGFGDAKLALGIGWFLGFINGLSAIILGFWIGAGFAIILLLTQKIKNKLNASSKNITMKTEIPFAPFLLLGVLIEFLFEIDVLNLGFLIQMF